MNLSGVDGAKGGVQQYSLGQVLLNFFLCKSINSLALRKESFYTSTQSKKDRTKQKYFSSHFVQRTVPSFKNSNYFNRN